MDDIAMNLVRKYVDEHTNAAEHHFDYIVYTVWKSKVLQNWKYLISTNIMDGMYYELTYNGDAKEWYLDAYKKVENRCIKV